MSEENLPAVGAMPISELYKEFKIGNPRKLDNNIKKRLYKSVKEGNSFRIACNACGLPYTTFKDWMEKGEEGYSPYFEFKLKMEQGAAIAAEEMTANLRKAGAKGNIGADQWLLAKLYPEVFGSNKKVDIKEDKKQEIKIIGLPSPNSPQLEKKESRTIEAKYKEFTNDDSK